MNWSEEGIRLNQDLINCFRFMNKTVFIYANLYALKIMMAIQKIKVNDLGNADKLENNTCSKQCFFLRIPFYKATVSPWWF